MNESHQKHHPVQHHASPQPQPQTPLPQQSPSPARQLLTPSPGHVTPLGSALPLAAASWQITHIFLPKEALSCRDFGAVELPKALALPLAPPAAQGVSLPPHSCSFCTPISKASPLLPPTQFQPQISQSPPWPQTTPTSLLSSAPWPFGAPRLGTGSGKRDLLSTQYQW